MRVEPLASDEKQSATPAPEAGIDQLWRHYAQRSSDGLLAALAGLIVPVIVFAVVGAMWVTRLQPWWPLLLAPLLASAFGFWGISDRELRGAPTSRASVTGWHVVRGTSVALAVACFVVGMLLFLRLTVGTWIS